MLDPVEETRRNHVANLYSTMPGAEPIPVDEQGRELIGEVMHTQHWRFCEQVYDLSVTLAQAYSR